MRVLLIHPEDELLAEPWGSQPWDHVIDLGLSGVHSYGRAVERFKCPVTPLAQFRQNFAEMKRVRELLEIGMGRLTDRCGLDWWELTSIFVHQELERIILLEELAHKLEPFDEIHVSRPCFHARILGILFPSRLKVFPGQNQRENNRIAHYSSVLKKFPARQLLEIFWDKTDPGYQFRGIFNRKRRLSTGPVVLLPSAYINASRTAVDYARSIPDSRFLLVSTRRSGWMDRPAPNVSVTWLRYYASLHKTPREEEYRELLDGWNAVQEQLMDVREFRILREIGLFDNFPMRFKMGLEIRDAWQNVLANEPVEAVICADDSNPYTHIPLLLAKERGLPTISCHHGALDGRYMFKRTHADILLAKGKMEQDYLVRVCEVPASKVEIGAPVLAANCETSPEGSKKPSIVLFSEAYEAAGGRARSFYEDILPPLVELAKSSGCELICKLHPAESFSERDRIIREILSGEQQKITQVVSGPLTDNLWNRAWFGITVMSTVAVECTLRGLPCFLCSWLEAWPYGYVNQFTQFGAGIRLADPAEIRNIPDILKLRMPNAHDRENCWTPMKPERLKALLGVDRQPLGTAAI